MNLFNILLAKHFPELYIIPNIFEFHVGDKARIEIRDKSRICILYISGATTINPDTTTDPQTAKTF